MRRFAHLLIVLIIDSYEVDGLENPTAEIIAYWFFQRIKNCEVVRVFENDDCWAEVFNDVATRVG